MEKESAQIIERLKQLEHEIATTPEAIFEHPAIAIEVFDAVPDAIILADDKNTIRLMNRSAEEMFGYDHDELVGRSVLELIPGRFRAAHLAKQKGFFKDPGKREFGDRAGLYARDKAGHEFPVKILLQPIPSLAGTLVMAIVRKR